MTVEGKVAVVTGAGQGIGQGIVHCLAEEGADMAVIDINGGNARKVTQTVQDIVDTFGRINILVNNVDGGMVTI